MEQTKKSKFKRKSSMIAAIVLILALLITGTYAWSKISNEVNNFDGKLGPKTLEAVRKLSGGTPLTFTEELLKQRKQYFDDIVVRNSSQGKFLNGWYRRLGDLAAEACVKSPL